MFQNIKYLGCVAKRTVFAGNLSSKFMLGKESQVIGFHTFRQLNVRTTSKPSLQKQQNDKVSIFVENKEKPFADLTLGEKVKQTGKDATNIGICLAGVGIVGTVIYTLWSELFSGQSPHGIYNKAHKYCLNDQKVLDALGTPVKAYGDIGGRRRRRNPISFSEQLKDGTKVMHVSFYLEGPKDKGRVWAKAQQNTKGKYELTQIILELSSYPYEQIFVVNQNTQFDDFISFK